MANDCLFCQIVAGKIPAHQIYEDEQCLAFLDIYPKNPGHTLIIPKQHFTNIEDLPTDLWQHLAKVGQQLARQAKINLQATGWQFHSHNGVSAAQEIFHFHLHLIPFYDPAQTCYWQELLEADKQSGLATIAAQFRGQKK